MAEPALPPARYEPEDVTFGFLLTGAAGVLLTVLLCAGFVIWLYPGVQHDHRLPSPLPVYPAPRLQANPQDDLRRFTAEELTRLNGLGWVDKQHGIVHIPIDEAMRRIVQQGIPDWPTRSGSKP